MKKIWMMLLILVLCLGMVACGEPTGTSQSKGSNPSTSTVPSSAAPEVRTVTIFREIMGEMVPCWEITGVYGESTFLSSGVSLRVLYVVSGSSATTLCNFYPNDYPYTGAYQDNDDDSFTYDHDRLVPYGQWKIFMEDDVIVKEAGGGYPCLPDGSWFFGDVSYSDSFFIVVGDPEAAKNGTLPSM